MAEVSTTFSTKARRYNMSHRMPIRHNWALGVVMGKVKVLRRWIRSKRGRNCHLSTTSQQLHRQKLQHHQQVTWSAWTRRNAYRRRLVVGLWEVLKTQASHRQKRHSISTTPRCSLSIWNWRMRWRPSVWKDRVSESAMITTLMTICLRIHSIQVPPSLWLLARKCLWIWSRSD